MRYSNKYILVLATIIVNPQRVEYNSNCACRLCVSFLNRARSFANNSKNMYSLFMSFTVILLKSIKSLISFTHNKSTIG